MALKSTIYKANLSIADIDHNYYAEHALTLARHPSETDERMMIRMAAVALQAWKLQSVCDGDGTLSFGAGLSDPDEPDVWLRDFTGRARLWVEVGHPDERALAKASSKADEVVVYCFQASSPIWWDGVKNKVTRLDRLSVYSIAAEQSLALAKLAQRSMNHQITIQDGALMLNGEGQMCSIEPAAWKIPVGA
jgi:uncharacterized protein YaeQ